MTNDELAAHLAAIRAASGAFTPDAVVDTAADPDHPLHDHFNWDDAEAADAWRRQQARILIARVQIIVQKTTARGVKDISVRALASVVSPLTDTREYMPVNEISQDAVLSAQVLEQIRAELAALRRKYAAYEGLFRVALDELGEQAA